MGVKCCKVWKEHEIHRPVQSAGVVQQADLCARLSHTARCSWAPASERGNSTPEFRKFRNACVGGVLLTPTFLLLLELEQEYFLNFYNS